MPAVGNVITGSGTVPTGGTTGQQLTKNSNTNYDIGWAAAGGGGGSPGGSTTQVQFNDAGAFAGDAAMTWDKTNHILSVSGSTTTPTIKLGTLELQDYGLGNAWIGENAFYDGAWKYRATGPAGLFYFFGNEGQFRFFTSGTGGSALSGSGNNIQFKVGYAGDVGFGAAISATGGAYTGSTMWIRSTATPEVRFAGNYLVGWTSASNDASGTLDTGLYRNATGVVEVNSGTAGTYRDLKLRNLVLSGGTQIPAASPTGLFLKDDGTYATPAGGSGAPGGSNTQVQYNNATAFGGITNATTDGTTMTLTSPKIVTNIKDTNANVLLGITATVSAVNDLTIANSATSTIGGTIGAEGTGTNLNIQVTPKGAGNLVLTSGIMIVPDTGYMSSTGISGTCFPFGTSYLSLRANSLDAVLVDGSGSPNIRIDSSVRIGWSSSTVGNAIDTAFSRNAAGVVEINNGTAGTYRDLKARTVNVTSDYQINGTSVAGDYINSSVASQTPAAVDVYLTGSNVTVPAGGFKAKGQYRCLFDVVKSAGTGIIVLTLRIGTAGAIGDTSRITFTFPAAGTTVADTGNMEVCVNWRTVGSGTTAVVSGFCRAAKNTITAAGLWSTTSAALTIVGTVSGGFDSSAATSIGLSFNGSTAFAGTITTIQTTLNQ